MVTGPTRPIHEPSANRRRRHGGRHGTLSQKTRRPRSRLRTAAKLLGFAFLGLMLLGAAGIGGGLYLLHSYGRDLPDYRQLADYQPPMVTRIHAGDGRLMAEYAQEKRVFVPIEVMPKRLIQAFLAAEDKNFYSHFGIDPLGLVRALATNAMNYFSNRRPVGASTITQQVAKNFLLTNEVSYERKLKEALLAFRIERAFTKDEILELYLNEIYLGVGSYGVAAAALNYFNKSLDNLTTAEAAFLAGLPKAPSRYHPVRAADEAKGRRDWVVGRMQELNVINAEEAAIARAEPLVMRKRDATELYEADYFTESVRRQLIQQYGEPVLYEEGLSIRTTIEPRLQEIAVKALDAGLVGYDQRHGWRGPVTRLQSFDNWPGQLEAIDRQNGLPAWQLAVVLELGPDVASIGLDDGTLAELPLAGVSWARRQIKNEKGEESLGPEVERLDQVIAMGDVIWVEEVAVETDVAADDDQVVAETAARARRFELRQSPEIEGAIVALDPHNGRVLAMSGGFSYDRSVFNRATQAKRQPGSALKPFVYLAGLEHGFTPSSIFLDAPVVYDQGEDEGKWKPENYSNQFYGPRTLRFGLEKSVNVMTVRLAREVGMGKVISLADRFGLANKMEYNLAASLGASEADLLTFTAAYAMLVNGGKRIRPAMIERIQDRHGKTVARRDERPCAGCQNIDWQFQSAPLLPDQREQVVDPTHAYQMVNMLQGVVENGTARKAKSIGKPVAGKTGTSNESRDAWFIGFTPDLAVGVYMGFDLPKSLGPKEQGASAALPIFVDFMTEALKDKPATPFRVPSGVRMVRIDADSGLLPGPTTTKVVLEAFLPGTEPREATPANYSATSTTGIVSGGRGGNGGAQTGGIPPRAGGLY